MEATSTPQPVTPAPAESTSTKADTIFSNPWLWIAGAAGVYYLSSRKPTASTVEAPIASPPPEVPSK